MLSFAVLCSLVALAFGEANYCCTPDQWEGHMGEIAGSVIQGQTHLVTGNISISYDFTNQKTATSSYLVTDGKLQIVEIILNYQTKMMYTIIGGKCTPSKLTGNMQKLCVPDSAVPVGHITYGVGSQSLAAQAYRVPVDQNSNVFVTVTVGDPCAPIGEVLYGSPSNVPTIQTMGYYDITKGIKDPSIFNPPSGCSGLKFEQAAPILPSRLMNYMHAKLTKQ